MNEKRHELDPHDQYLFGLLVDGELDEARRRELLLRLDSEPDGWRRCALAFLESREWGHASRALAHESGILIADFRRQPATAQNG